MKWRDPSLDPFFRKSRTQSEKWWIILSNVGKKREMEMDGGGGKRRLAESASPLLEPKDAKIKVSIWSIASSEET